MNALRYKPAIIRTGKRMKGQIFCQRTEYLSQDRQIQLSVKRQYMLFQMVHSCKKRANRQNRILVDVENSSSERNLQLGENLGLL